MYDPSWTINYVRSKNYLWESIPHLRFQNHPEICLGGIGHRWHYVGNIKSVGNLLLFKKCIVCDVTEMQISGLVSHSQNEEQWDIQMFENQWKILRFEGFLKGRESPVIGQTLVVGSIT